MKTFKLNYDAKLEINYVINNIEMLWKLKPFFKLIENKNLTKDYEFELINIIDNKCQTRIYNNIINIYMYFNIPYELTIQEYK